MTRCLFTTGRRGAASLLHPSIRRLLRWHVDDGRMKTVLKCAATTVTSLSVSVVAMLWRLLPTGGLRRTINPRLGRTRLECSNLGQEGQLRPVHPCQAGRAWAWLSFTALSFTVPMSHAVEGHGDVRDVSCVLFRTMQAWRFVNIGDTDSWRGAACGRTGDVNSGRDAVVARGRDSRRGGVEAGRTTVG